MPLGTLGAGIVVRNSIILVDFIELRLKQGRPLDQAVIDGGAVRFRPMMLTVAAVIVGAGVILFDPIFQGLAISLMAGVVASLLLWRLPVPALYFCQRGALRRPWNPWQSRPMARWYRHDGTGILKLLLAGSSTHSDGGSCAGSSGCAFFFRLRNCCVRMYARFMSS